MSDEKKLSDEQIKEMLLQLKSNIEVPEPSNWEQVHASVVKQAQKKHRWLTVKQIASISAAALLISIFISNTSSPVSAQLTSFFKVLQNEVVYIFLSDIDGNDKRISNHDISLSKNASPIFKNNDELINILEQMDFSPALPQFIPEGFTLDNTELVIDEFLQALTIQLFDANGQFITIKYQNVEEQYSIVKSNDRENLKYDEFNVGDYTGIITVNDKNIITMSWIDNQQVSNTIITNIDHSELMRIINRIY